MPNKIIIDTDPGIDDAMALLFAARAPQIDLVGITTTFGNALIDQTTRNAHYLNERFDLGAPVHTGAARPLFADLDPPADFVHGSDGLGQAGLVIPDVAGDAGDGVQFLIDQLRAHPGEITVVAIGRLTNLALALARAPDIVDLVKSVVIMGGALGRGGFGGNVTPVAEANVIGDPHAADRVLRAAWPVVMVGLDVTMQTVMMQGLVEDLRDNGGETGEFIYAITRFYQKFYKDNHGLEGFAVHDSSAVAYLLAPDLFKTEAGGLRVMTEGLAYGQTVLAPAGKTYPIPGWQDLQEQHACVDVRADAVLDLIMTTLLDA
ncbi:MAG: nucleoside hydrolase [Pseudomonadota bacterium]